MIKPDDRQRILTETRNLKMAQSAHAYVRGSTARFYEWLESSSRCKLPEGPPVWICGDCHVGNLGPLADTKGHVLVQIRDLDQTVIGNPAHDLVRLGLSLASAARGSDPPGVTTARIFEEVVAGYQAALSTNFEVDKEKSHRPKALLVQSTRRRWRHLAEERLDTIKPTIPLGKRFWALTPDHRGMGYRSPRGKVLPHFMPESKALRSSWEHRSLQVRTRTPWTETMKIFSIVPCLVHIRPCRPSPPVNPLR
jgi:uncharacterized protein (DUF2252 family)